MKTRTRYQRMELATQLAGVIMRNTTDQDLRDLAMAIQYSLAAPAKTLAAVEGKIIEAMERIEPGSSKVKV